MSEGYSNPAGSLPSVPGWKTRAIEDVCQAVTSGGTPLRSRTEYYEGGTIQWFKTKELKDNTLFKSEEQITQLAIEETSAKLFPKDTVLMAMYGDGKTITSLGMLGEEAASNQACCAMIVNQESCEPRFLFYTLRHHRDDFIRMASGGAQRNLSGRLIRRFAIGVPNLPVQRRIAHILGTLDDKIELNRRMNRTLEAIARAIFKSWFVDFLPVRAKIAARTQTGDPVHARAEGREIVGMDPETAALFPDSFQDSPLGKIPKGWDIGGVSDFAKVRYGPAYASKLFNDKGDGLPLLRIRDLRTHAPQVFTTEEHPRGEVVSLGDIVIGMDGEFRAHLWTGPDSWMNQRVCKLAPLQQELRSFLYFAAKRPLAECERSKTGTTVIHLGKGDIDSFRLLRPPHAILEAYSRLSDPILSLGTRLAGSSSVLASLRDAMLPRLLSGSLTVEATGET